MSELQCVARLKIHDGKLDEFKRLATKCAELVRTKDSGTLQHELYFNSDNTMGRGRRFFPDGTPPTKLRLVESKMLSFGSLALAYQPANT